MSSLQPRPGHWLLRCPLCRTGFTAAAGALVCRSGHSFDLARGGYVNLLSGRGRRPAAAGDSLAQLRHRAEFLDAGYFDAVAAMVAAHVDDGTHGSWHILDAGSGTGHHLAGIAARLHGTVSGLGFDISRDAARLAGRRWPPLAFVVADLWGEWPVCDAAVDLVISIFAPKNFREMARVLRPGGCLALAYPGPEHLIELRDRFNLLHQNEESSGRYAEMTARFIGPPSVARLHRHVVLEPEIARATILMGPNARHVDPAILDVGTTPLGVTFDIDLLLAARTVRTS